MHALAQLLVDNGDPCNTRYNILTDAEIEAIKALCLKARKLSAIIDEWTTKYKNWLK